MRERILAVLLCFSLAAATGCAAARQESKKDENSYLLYYEIKDLNSAKGSDAISTETAALDDSAKEGLQHRAEVLLSRLLSGPKTENLVNTAPTGTTLLSVTLNGDHAVVDLSAAYGSLSGISLTLADYCITMTLTQLPEIQTVSVTVRGQELAYRDNQNFSDSDVLLSSTEDVVGVVPVSLYFPDGNGALTPEKRTLELYEGDTQSQTVLKALEDGPENDKLLFPFPENFSVQSVWMEDDLCYVNLSSSALESFADQTEIQTALMSMTKSLCSLKTVGAVQFVVDGESTESYGGVEISQAWDGTES